MQAWRDSPALEAALSGLSPIVRLLTGEISVLDSVAAGLQIKKGGLDATAVTRHRLLFDERTFSTFLIYWSEPSGEPLDLSLTLPVEGVPGVYRIEGGTRLQPSNYSRVQESGRVALQLPQPGGAAPRASTAEAPRL